MKLLVGLGNPGSKYARNRHNIGFMAVDEIAKAHNCSPWRSRFKGDVSEGLIEGQKCLLLKPGTFMNLSGEAVREAAQFYKIPLENIIIFHDEIDLPPSKVKVKEGGGNAGHNGLKSISAHMGNGYVRVRLGVGRPELKQDVPNYVLKDFAKADQDWLDDLLRALARHMTPLLANDFSSFLSKVGQDLRPANPAKNPKTESSKENHKPKLTTQKQETKSKGALGAALERWLGGTPDKGEM